MRVALVCPYDLSVPGGVQAHVLALARHLRACGDEVAVVAPAGGPAPAGATTVGGTVGVPFNASVAPVALSPTAARRAVAEVRRSRPHVVHVHEPAVPVVSLAVTLRGPQPQVGTFHAWSDTDRLYRAARPLVRPLVDRLAARVAVSAPAAAYHAAALGLPEGSFRTIPNGVEVARFADARPLPDLDDPDRPTLLFVGRLEARKGLADLVRAFVRLKATRPSLRLLVVGEGPERSRCQELLPATLRPDAPFLGQVTHEDLPRFYASADVFVAPARGGESFGMVLLEAMAAGLPVVATDIPGYRSLIRDGVEGRLVPPSDAPTLADALDALLGNPSLRTAMAEAGRRAVADHDWSVVAARMRDLYLEVVGRPPSPKERSGGDQALDSAEEGGR